MNLEEIGKKIAQYGAPLLGAAVAGPAGAIAAQLALKGLGLSSDDPMDIIKTLEADPESIARLIEFESNNKVELERIAAQREENTLKYDYLNVDSARHREVELAKAGHKDNTPRLLSLIYSTAYALLMGCYLIVKMFHRPDLNLDTWMMALTNGEVMVLGYYFGASYKNRILGEK